MQVTFFDFLHPMQDFGLGLWLGKVRLKDRSKLFASYIGSFDKN